MTIILETRCFKMEYTSAIMFEIEGYIFDTLHEINERGNKVKLTKNEVEGLVKYMEERNGNYSEIFIQLYTVWKNMLENERMTISWN